MVTSISTTQDFLARDSAQLALSRFLCPECGRVHAVPIGKMQVGTDLISSLCAFARQSVQGSSSFFAGVIYDQTIEAIIRAAVLEPLAQEKFPYTSIPLSVKNHNLDSEINLSNYTADSLDPRVNFLIAAGSGVITDITKWVATRRKIPYAIFGTAPSMNAYTSITATMTEKDVKTSYLLDPAAAVFMDTGLQAAAPIHMIHAGMGDLAARAICNADWRLSNFLFDTYFCPLPYWMTAENERRFLAAAPEIAQRAPSSINHLSEAVLMSGLSMTVLDGETSPSSGAEHVISHFWDLLSHVRGLPKNLHGTQVGIATIIMLTFYEVMRTYDITKVDPQKVLRNRPSIETLEADNQRLYGNASPLFSAVVRKKRVPDAQFMPYLRSILDRWGSLWQTIDPYISALDHIRQPLQAAGMHLTLDSLRRTPAEGMEALLKGPQYRSRYTILDLAWELGILPEIAEVALAKSGVLAA